MQKFYGSNIIDVKKYNRSLILKLICTNELMSRSQLARETNLAKMTLSNIVSDLIVSGIIVEKDFETGDQNYAVGRRPILLDLSEKSPLICGILIKRGLFQVILADLRAQIIDSINVNFERLNSADELLNILTDSYKKLSCRCERKIVAISISSVGPVDIRKGVILNPPDFYGLSNIPIVGLIREATGKPTFLINDANAGALAEKIYGHGQSAQNFIYLHMMNGIGAGVILDNELYEGNSGQSCELGHTSISFTGPKCTCGNTGCLDLYANLAKMNETAEALKYIFPNSVVFSRSNPIWDDYVAFANQGDPLAMNVVNQFCDYVSYALTNLLNILDTNLVIVGYDCDNPGAFIEQAISNKINKTVLFSKYSSIEVRRSAFKGKGPLVGSIAFVTNKLFNSSLAVSEFDDELLNSVFSEET